MYTSPQLKIFGSCYQGKHIKRQREEIQKLSARKNFKKTQRDPDIKYHL